MVIQYAIYLQVKHSFPRMFFKREVDILSSCIRKTDGILS